MKNNNQKTFIIKLDFFFLPIAFPLLINPFTKKNYNRSIILQMRREKSRQFFPMKVCFYSHHQTEKKIELHLHLHNSDINIHFKHL